VAVFKEIVREKLPRLVAHFEKLEYELSHIVNQWFLTLFIGHLPTEVRIRIRLG
jgi:hypothetical protein